MGGLIIKNETLETWRKEKERTVKLINMVTDAEVHKQVIEQCQWENSLKRFALTMLGLSFGLSTYRYFPGIFPRDPLFTGLWLLTIMQPFHLWAVITTNRETIAILTPIYYELKAERSYRMSLNKEASQDRKPSDSPYSNQI